MVLCSLYVAQLEQLYHLDRIEGTATCKSNFVKRYCIIKV